MGEAAIIRVRWQPNSRFQPTAFSRRKQSLLAISRSGRRVAVYRRLLALDNYLELAHRELMRCFARQGETSHAIQHFQQFREMLHTELQAEPSAETIRLYERLKRGENV